jgi:hypothetical protein
MFFYNVCRNRSKEIFETCPHIAGLTSTRLIQGLSHFSALGYPCPELTNPSDFFLDTITVDFRTPDRAVTSTERITLFQKKWSSMQPAAPSGLRMLSDQRDTNEYACRS